MVKIKCKRGSAMRMVDVLCCTTVFPGLERGPNHSRAHKSRTWREKNPLTCCAGCWCLPPCLFARFLYLSISRPPATEVVPTNSVVGLHHTSGSVSADPFFVCTIAKQKTAAAKAKGAAAKAPAAMRRSSKSAKAPSKTSG